MEEIFTSISENFLDLDVLIRSRTLLVQGLVNFLQLVVVSFGLALVVGLVLMGMARSGVRWVRTAVGWWVDVVRATPPLVFLSLTFYMVPDLLSYGISPYQAGVVTFSLIQGAYLSEIYRGGLAGFREGQREAATALGMTRVQAIRYIVIPQVFMIIIPPLTSQATQLGRDASLTFFIGYEEIVTKARQAANLTGNSTAYTGAAIIYVAILLSLQLLSTHLERRRSASGT